MPSVILACAAVPKKYMEGGGGVLPTETDLFQSSHAHKSWKSYEARKRRAYFRPIPDVVVQVSSVGIGEPLDVLTK